MKINESFNFGSSGLVGKSLERVLSKSTKVDELICSTRNDTNLIDLSSTKEKISNENQI